MTVTVTGFSGETAELETAGGAGAGTDEVAAGGAGAGALEETAGLDGARVSVAVTGHTVVLMAMTEVTTWVE